MSTCWKTSLTTAVLVAGLALGYGLTPGGMSHAQQETAPATAVEPWSGLTWRNLGPNRGGRSIAVAGSDARPYEYYFGATGGGLWKTADGGTTWKPVTDTFLKYSSVGAVAVAPS